MVTQDGETWDGSLHPSQETACCRCCLRGLGASLYDGPSHSSGEDLPQPRLEEEIDSLAQELALKEKEAGHSRLTAQPWPEAAQKFLEPGEDPPPLMPTLSLPLARVPDPASLSKGQGPLTLCACLSAATLGFSQWGQGLEPGLPSTHGTSQPTPHASLGSPVSSGPVHMSPLEPQGGHGNGLTLGRSRLAVRDRHVAGRRRRHKGDGTGGRLRTLLRRLLTMPPPSHSADPGFLLGQHSRPGCGSPLLV